MVRTPSHEAAGFTLGELLIVSVLMMALTLVTAQVWRFLSADMTDLTARVRVAKELRFAVQSISGDMGPVVGATPVATDSVLLCKDGGSVPDGQANWGEPDVVVQYYLCDGKLHRLDQSNGKEIVVADDISVFTAEDLTESLMRMTVEARRGGIRRQVKLIWSRP